MSQRMVTMLLAAALLLPVVVGCQNSDEQYYARALAIERELLRQNPSVDYSDDRYLHVMRELQKVPLRSADRKRAQDFLGRISDGRRLALLDRYPKHVKHLPDRLAGNTSEPKGEGQAGAPGADEQSAKLDITMYSTAWCGYCRKARRWFNDNGFAFVEKDIEKSAEAQREYQGVAGGYGGVPLIVVNGKTFRGFDPGTLLRRIREIRGGS